MSASEMPEPRHASLPGVKLCYRDSGGDGAPLVLLHANTGTSTSWLPQWAAFTGAGYRVIAFDRRGWGDSRPDPATGPQPASIAEDLNALAGHLKLPAFHLLGVAGGGFAALDFAGWQHSKLRSLIVAASTGSFSEPEMEQLVRNISFDGIRELPETFREIGPSFRAAEPDKVRAWAHAQEQAKQPGAVQPPLQSPNTFAKIAKIKCPCLVVTAGADLLAPPALMARWYRHIPQAKVVDIPNVGHCMPMEAPEQFNATVLDFLRQH